MLSHPQTIPGLELEEMEAWREYQQHAKETERLKQAWVKANAVLLRARIEWDRQQAICKLKSH